MNFKNLTITLTGSLVVGFRTPEGLNALDLVILGALSMKVLTLDEFEGVDLAGLLSILRG